MSRSPFRSARLLLLSAGVRHRPGLVHLRRRRNGGRQVASATQPPQRSSALGPGSSCSSPQWRSASVRRPAPAVAEPGFASGQFRPAVMPLAAQAQAAPAPLSLDGPRPADAEGTTSEGARLTLRLRTTGTPAGHSRHFVSGSQALMQTAEWHTDGGACGSGHAMVAGASASAT